MNVINSTFDLERIHQECHWFLLIFAAVMFAMFCDLIAGLIKAWQRNEARTSTGLKRTALKCERYFLPLLCTCCFDVVVSSISTYPFFTALLGLFFIVTEVISIFEKTHTKEQLRENEKTMNVILKNKEDIVSLVSDVLQRAREEKEQTEDGD